MSYHDHKEKLKIFTISNIYGACQCVSPITFMTNTIKINNSTLSMAKENVTDNFNAVKLAVANNGKMLQYASDRLKNNREIVKLAVKQNGISIQYANNFFLIKKSQL